MTQTESSIQTTPRAVFFLDTKTNKCCYLTESEIDDVISGSHPISVSRQRHNALPDHDTLLDVADTLKSGKTDNIKEIMYSFVN